MSRAKLAPAGSAHPVDLDVAPIRLPADKRREQLIKVAVELFSRKGFNGTTTREIAAAAGVTEAIIFRHFQTKEQLYTAIIDQRIKAPDTVEWIADFRSAMARDDDEAVIRQLIGAIIWTHKSNPEFERLMIYAALEGNEIALLYMRQATATIIEAYRSYFRRRQQEGRFSAVDPDAALMAIAGMAQHYASARYVHNCSGKDMQLSDEQALESFCQIAMNGFFVRTHPGTGKEAQGL